MSEVKVDFSQAFSQIDKFAQFGVKQAAIELEKQVIREISEGRSPVKRAGGRFKKYSDSYKQQIKGEVTFRKINGRIVPIRPKKGSRLDNEITKLKNGKVSPVNLKLSGDLLRSVFSTPITRNKIRFGFDNFLADIHNRQGAGKSKVVRRMLPTKPGETFTDNILIAVGIRLKRLANRVFR